jgi:tetratricopeptide (TPR) repeat protein
VLPIILLLSVVFSCRSAQELRKSAVDEVIAEATILRASGEYSGVAALYESAASEYGEDARVWYNLAVAYAEVGNLGKSLETFGILNELTGRTNTKYLQAESSLAYEMGLVDHAVELWTEVVALDPMESEVRFKLIEVLSESGRYEQAYAQAMELYKAGGFGKDLFNDLATLERETGRGDGTSWNILASTYE